MLIPNDRACPSAASDVAQEMAAHLTRARSADPDSSLHWGELACIQGKRQAARQSWEAETRRTPAPPLHSLFAAIVAFPDHDILASPYMKAIADYATQFGSEKERQKDLATAIDWYEFAFAYAPSEAAAGKLASLYRRLGEDASAEEVWHRLQTSFSSESPEYWWAVGQMAEQKKDWEAAANAYHKAAELATNTDAFKYLSREGLMWRRARDFDHARIAYQKAIALMPDKIDAYLGMGETYRAQKAYEEAAQWFARAQELFPKDYRPPYYLGLVARAQKNYEDALAHFDASLALKPDNPSVLYYKAITLDAMQRRGEAIQTLSQAIAHHKNPPENWRKLLSKWERYPDYAQDPDRWWERGRAAEQEKDWSRAAALYAEGAAKAQPPDDYRLLEREALMHRYLKEWDEAAAIYEDLAARYPDKINAYLGMGEVYRAQGRYEEAAQWFARAQELFPEDYRPPYYLGLAALGLKQYDDALAHFDRALSLKPGQVYVLYYKAQALHGLGRIQEAIAALEQAINLHTNPPKSWEELLKKWKESL